MIAGGPFGAIYADPPWPFLTYGKKHTIPHRSAHQHYQTMPMDEMMAMPVAACAAKDCALFMWIVDSHLDVAIDLGRAWGFQFKTVAFIWAKLQAEKQQLTLLREPHRIGMGYWTRKQAEICLMFTRGKPRRIDKGVRQIIEAPRREHSRKPDETYGLIERLVAGPYLELWARQTHPGWSSWGNEVGKFDGVAA